MTDWLKKRRPDEVPTPVAVAVSDFCRRARSPASAAEVREALALLGDEDDFRVRTLTDGEPPARPLGPFALIDILGGAEPEVAARRQGCGYYALAQQLAEARAQPPPVLADVETPPSSAPSRPVRVLAAKTPPAPPPATVAEKIAPKKRAPVVVSDEEGAGIEELPRRELPKGRGRFTRLAAARLPGRELLASAAADYLSGLVEQGGHRVAVLKTLNEQYTGLAGSLLSMEELETVLQQHQLLAPLKGSERELLLGSYQEHRGAAGRVAWALGITPIELEKLVKMSGLEREVNEVRERFVREALSPKNLGLRLDLLGRTRYLTDLGIKKRFTDSLSGDLRSLLKRSLRDATSYEELLEQASRTEGVSRELLSRGVDKLGLASEFRKRLSHPPAPSSL